LHVDDGDSVMLRLQTPDGRTVQVSLSRRDLATLLAAGGLRAILPAAVTDPDAAVRVSRVLGAARRVDPQVLELAFRTSRT
jgi:hypothetical protein